MKVKLQGVNPRVSRTGSQIDGSVLLTSKGDKLVLKMSYKFVMKKTTGRGEDRKVKDFTLAQVVREEQFEIKTGETKTLEFSIPYSLERASRTKRAFSAPLENSAPSPWAKRKNTSSSPCAT